MTDDLFDGATALRRKPSPPRGRAPAGRMGTLGEAEYNGRLDRGARGPGAGAPPPRHVYRRRRRQRPASSLRRGDRQCDGRGGGGPCDLHRGFAGGRRLAQRRRQRTRHAGRPAPEIPGQVGARNYHDQAARRRQIRQRGLRDVGRPARRRRFRGQRSFSAHRGRSGAWADALPAGVRARPSRHQARNRRQGAQPAGHQGALSSRRADFRQEGEIRPGAAVQDDALEGLSLRRRRNPLALRRRLRRSRGQGSRARRRFASPAA